MLRGVILALFVAGGLAADDDHSGFRFTAKVETLPGGGSLIGDWKVGGRTVKVTSATRIEREEGPVTVGACVEVRGAMTAPLAVAATRIETLDARKCASQPGAEANPVEIEFIGNVEQLPASGFVGNWKVSGRTVVVSATTDIDQDRGPITVGACVSVEGTLNLDGSIKAREVETKAGQGGCKTPPGQARQEVEFEGVVQNLPAGGGLTGQWTISGRKVQVQSTTEVVPRSRQVGVGSCVQVRGRLQSDASILAEKIEIERECGVFDQAVPVFFGKVKSMPPGPTGDLVIGTRTVRATASTQVRTDSGPIQVGTCVEVRGQLIAGDVILADLIASRPATACEEPTPVEGRFELVGTVQSVPPGGKIGDWKIGSRTVRANASTVFDTSKGPLVVGACAEARGSLLTDGTMLASKIETKSASGVCLMTGGVVGAGSLMSRGVAPGEIVSIFGLNIGPATSLPLQLDTAGRVSAQLANTRVLFDGVPATLLFVSSKQINAVVPSSVAGRTSTTVQVESGGAWSNTLTVPILSSAPSIFTLNGSGQGQGAILNFDLAAGGYTVNGPGSAAARNGVVLIFGTGDGQTNPARVDGAVVNPFLALPRPLLPVSVTIGGKRAVVEYAGAAPGFVSGVLQVNARVPADVTPGPNVPVVITVGSQSSQDGVTMAVK